jgi:ketol-acid reductoisomerase
MTTETIHLVGFGSQGSAWAQCLRTSGWDVRIYLARKSKSYEKALALGFTPLLLSNLLDDLKAIQNSLSTDSSPQPLWIALLCPDSEIPRVYQDFLRDSPCPLRILLAHGYAIYSNELELNAPLHQAFLLAPKAIGPKLLQSFSECFPQPHRLVAAICPNYSSADSADSSKAFRIARALGFSVDTLVSTSFEKEAIGDLISEQGLLCGGVFNLLDWTVQAMREAKIPPALIREECLTELELIASLIREKGPASAFGFISQAAQAGTIAIQDRLERSGFRGEFDQQMQSIHSREFAGYFRSNQWQKAAEELKTRLLSLETETPSPPLKEKTSHQEPLL